MGRYPQKTAAPPKAIAQTGSGSTTPGPTSPGPPDLAPGLASPAAAATAAAMAAGPQRDPVLSAHPEADLAALQQKRRDVGDQLREVERQIYELETKYLEGCNPAANALRGYEGLMSQPVQQYKKPAGHVRAEDRLFSGSSLTGWAHLAGAP